VKSTCSHLSHTATGRRRGPGRWLLIIPALCHSATAAGRGACSDRRVGAGLAGMRERFRPAGADASAGGGRPLRPACARFRARGASKGNGKRATRPAAETFCAVSRFRPRPRWTSNRFNQISYTSFRVTSERGPGARRPHSRDGNPPFRSADGFVIRFSPEFGFRSEWELNWCRRGGKRSGTGQKTTGQGNAGMLVTGQKPSSVVPKTIESGVVRAGGSSGGAGRASSRPDGDAAMLET